MVESKPAPKPAPPRQLALRELLLWMGFFCVALALACARRWPVNDKPPYEMEATVVWLSTLGLGLMLYLVVWTIHAAGFRSRQIRFSGILLCMAVATIAVRVTYEPPGGPFAEDPVGGSLFLGFVACLVLWFLWLIVDSGIRNNCAISTFFWIVVVIILILMILPALQAVRCH